MDWSDSFGFSCDSSNSNGHEAIMSLFDGQSCQARLGHLIDRHQNVGVQKSFDLQASNLQLGLEISSELILTILLYSPRILFLESSIESLTQEAIARAKESIESEGRCKKKYSERYGLTQNLVLHWISSGDEDEHEKREKGKVSKWLLPQKKKSSRNHLRVGFGVKPTRFLSLVSFFLFS